MEEGDMATGEVGLEAEEATWGRATCWASHGCCPAHHLSPPRPLAIQIKPCWPGAHGEDCGGNRG